MTALNPLKTFAAVSDGHGRHLTPAAALSINGQPFGRDAVSRIISIELTDKRGFEADELTVVLSDHDGALAIPRPGDILTLAIGYQETGLVDKGRFMFSEFTASGAPDTLSITARSADLADSLAEQKEKSWHKTTVYEIAATIARAHGYEPAIADTYKNDAIAHLDQTNESDAAFLSRLAQDCDAIATVKNGRLLFLPAGQALTAGGQPVPPLEIRRSAGDGHNFTYSATDSYEAVTANYTDKATGQKKSVTVAAENLKQETKTVTETNTSDKKGKKGKKGKAPAAHTVAVNRRIDAAGKKTKTLRHLYSSEKNAWRGARAAFRRLKRGAAVFSLNLAAGRPELYPETPVTVSGWKPEIDNEKWITTEITHRLDEGGYTCALNLEALIDWAAESDDNGQM